MEKNTVVGIDFLIVGIVVATAAYVWTQSVPIVALGFAISIIGALLLLVVSEPIPRDAYNALLNDSIANMELILSESDIKERAYTVPGEDGKIRAFIPLRASGSIELVDSRSFQRLRSSSQTFISSDENLKGLVMIQPGNDLVRVAKIDEKEDITKALREVLVTFSALATSVSVAREGDSVRVEVKNPRISYDFPNFNQCLGSAVASIASCVVARTEGRPVRISDERVDRSILYLSLEIMKV